MIQSTLHVSSIVIEIELSHLKSLVLQLIIKSSFQVLLETPSVESRMSYGQSHLLWTWYFTFQKSQFLKLKNCNARGDQKQVFIFPRLVEF